MAITNINNNNTAQLQAYGQEKLASAKLISAQEAAERKTVASTADSVQISDQAKALLAKEVSATTLGNGGGIEPPKTTTRGNGGGIEPPKSTVLGNGGGIEPPKTTALGNGGGIEPPRTTSLGNGGGIEPPNT